MIELIYSILVQKTSDITMKYWAIELFQGLIYYSSWPQMVESSSSHGSSVPIIDVPFQAHAGDSGFFAIKFMELWNGESFHVPIRTECIPIYRSQLLFYGLYHPMNNIQKLPSGLEVHRPRRTYTLLAK